MVHEWLHPDITKAINYIWPCHLIRTYEQCEPFHQLGSAKEKPYSIPYKHISQILEIFEVLQYTLHVRNLINKKVTVHSYHGLTSWLPAVLPLPLLVADVSSRKKCPAKDGNGNVKMPVDNIISRILKFKNQNGKPTKER